MAIFDDFDTQPSMEEFEPAPEPKERILEVSTTILKDLVADTFKVSRANVELRSAPVYKGNEYIGDYIYALVRVQED